MPLRKGRSDAVLRANIRELIKSGLKRNEAVAIAMQRAGKKKPTKKDFRKQAALRLRKGMKAK